MTQKIVYKKISGKIIIDLVAFLEKEIEEAKKEIKDAPGMHDGCCIDNFASGRRAACIRVQEFLLDRMNRRKK